jgi:hypothetical protein
MTYVLNGIIDFVMSMVALFVWFHWDLEGWFETRRHSRMMKVGKRHDRRGND